MQDIYRVCGNRLNNYTESDGWPTESLPAFDMQAKMQRLVFDDIKYAFLTTLIPRDPSRYSTGEWPVYYAAMHPITAIHEVAHHYRKEHLGKEYEVEYKRTSKIVYKIHAEFENQRIVPDEEKYIDPVEYHQCQIFAQNANDDDCCSLRAKSVRHLDGICFPIFRERILKISPSLEHKFEMRWYCEDDRLTQFAEGSENEISMYR